MAKITALSYWKDIGYIESDRKVPSFSSLYNLPTESGSYNSPLNISADRLFSEIQLPLPFSSLENIQYLLVSVSYNNGPQRNNYYGWVDSVECKSDTTDYPMTVIKWHIDPWRTFLSSGSYSGGKVERATAISNFTRYKQPAIAKYFHVTEEHTLINLGHPSVAWVYLCVNYQDSSTVYTKTYCFPIYTQFGSSVTGHIGNYNGTDDNITIKNDDVIDGSWTSYLGIQLSNITYVCVSPCPPCGMTGDILTSGNPLRPNGNKWRVTQEIIKIASYPNTYVYEMDTGDSVSSFDDITIDVSSYSVNSTELQRWIISGFNGETIHEIPFGMSVQSIIYRTVIGPLSGYIELRAIFNDGDTNSSKTDARSNGLCAAIPLIPLELSSNSANAYVYSGQRQYDIESATIQRNKSLVSGLTGIGETALIGAFSGNLGLGAGIGAVSAAGNYLTSEYFDKSAQSSRDALAASQPDTMLLSGSGFDTLWYGQGIKIKKLSADQDSQDHFTNVINNDGYIIGDYITTNFDTILRALTGAVKITQLQIGGSIPVYAKDYIRNRFANGVILS